MNSKLEIWLNSVNKEIAEDYKKNFPNLRPKQLTYKKGRKFVKIMNEDSVWGFVSMQQCVHKGSLVCVGDLLKAESWKTPAKHSRGNIFDGTAKWDVYGPLYIK
tara:strand:+ start:321 stop:632 length:312 start_codon:yes stop_codon:yes gene_type:complete